MADNVGWFDLGAADEAPLKTFYSELFGWTLAPMAETYTVLATGGGIQGGIGRSQTGDPWLAFYVGAADPQATLDKAESLGGKTVVPVTQVPDMLEFAMFTDPDGLLVAVMRPTVEPSGEPTPGTGAPVDWFEILGSDAKKSQGFYAELFGWTYEQAPEGYGMVQTEPGPWSIPGAVGGSGEGKPWATVYANVDDVEKYLARAEELGGTREYGPIDVDDHMQAGAFRDPVGNVFGVYHHEPH